MTELPWHRRWLLRWEVIVGFAVLAGAAWIVTRIFYYDWFNFPSQSMYPTIPEGSLLVVDKHGYGNYGAFGLVLVPAASTAPIQRGDIMVFRLATDPGTLYAKRIIGLPGERIVYVDRRLSINAVAVETRPGRHDDRYEYATEILDSRSAEIAFMPERYSPDVDVTVPKNQFFVMGDNRDNSRDSRYIGFVPRENIVGRLVYTLSFKQSDTPQQ